MASWGCLVIRNLRCGLHLYDKRSLHDTAIQNGWQLHEYSLSRWWRSSVSLRSSTELPMMHQTLVFRGLIIAKQNMIQPSIGPNSGSRHPRNSGYLSRNFSKFWCISTTNFAPNLCKIWLIRIRWDGNREQSKWLTHIFLESSESGPRAASRVMQIPSSVVFKKMKWICILKL